MSNQIEGMLPTSTAVAPIERGGLPEYIPQELAGFSGSESLGEEDLVIPRYKIVQPTSRAGTAGTFLCNLTGEEQTQLEILVVKIEKGRTMWDKDNQESETPLCRSYDYMNPDSAIENPPSPICAKMVTNPRTGKQVPVQVCPMGSWEENEKPPCGAVYNLLCISLSDMLPFWISLHGASVRPVKNFASSIMLRRAPFWRFQTSLTATLKTEPKKHYVATFSPPKQLDPATEQEIVPTVLALKDASVQRTFEAEELAKDAQGESGSVEDPKMPAFMKEKQ